MKEKNLIPLTETQKRYDALCIDFVQNGGFTEQQAAFLIKFLNDFLPLY